MIDFLKTLRGQTWTRAQVRDTLGEQAETLFVQAKDAGYLDCELVKGSGFYTVSLTGLKAIRAGTIERMPVATSREHVHYKTNYTPPRWTPARPGADDHNHIKSKGF